MAKTKESFSPLTLAAIDAALEAGDLLKKGFGTRFSVSSKWGSHNLVTEYDRRSEAFLLKFLSREVKGSRFVAEESGQSGKGAEVLWYVDPLDGTVNFAHQIPVFAVSIAAEVDGQMVSGVVYAPMLQELFVAERGKGAFLNGKKLAVTKTKELKETILATGFPYNIKDNPNHCIEHFEDILKLGIPIRRLGSAAIDLSYVAAGRVDGFFEVSLAPWDVGAGMLLVEEAGGKITGWNKKTLKIMDKGPVLATNGHIHGDLAKMLSRAI
ncbi:MAG: inositol monophosphatase [Chlamydiia bacterium]|nr:inositol monophosphatase [Chlamydiia bacterium]